MTLILTKDSQDFTGYVWNIEGSDSKVLFAWHTLAVWFEVENRLTTDPNRYVITLSRDQKNEHSLKILKTKHNHVLVKDLNNKSAKWYMYSNTLELISKNNIRFINIFEKKEQ